MKVKSKMSCPIRKEDGSWTTVIKEFEEEIPDKGRHSLICNKCIERMNLIDVGSDEYEIIKNKIKNSIADKIIKNK